MELDRRLDVGILSTIDRSIDVRRYSKLLLLVVSQYVTARNVDDRFPRVVARLITGPTDAVKQLTNCCMWMLCGLVLAMSDYVLHQKLVRVFVVFVVIAIIGVIIIGFIPFNLFIKRLFRNFLFCCLVVVVALVWCRCWIIRVSSSSCSTTVGSCAGSRKCLRLSSSGAGRPVMMSCIVIGCVLSWSSFIVFGSGAKTTRLRDKFSTVWSGYSMTTVFASLLTSLTGYGPSAIGASFSGSPFRSYVQRGGRHCLLSESLLAASASACRRLAYSVVERSAAWWSSQ